MMNLCPKCGQAAAITTDKPEWFGTIGSYGLTPENRHVHTSDQWARPHRCLNCGHEASYVGKSPCPECYNQWAVLDSPVTRRGA